MVKENLIKSKSTKTKTMKDLFKVITIEKK